MSSFRPRQLLHERDAAAWIPQRGLSRVEIMDRDARLRRLRFRAAHRGTREADMLIGGFAELCSESWGEAELDWFEQLLEEQDVDIMAWAIGTAAVPERYEGPMMRRMRNLDYLKHKS